MKLISMTSYVLEQLKWIKDNNKVEKEHDFTDHIALERLENYVNFLRTPLELGLFIACDEDGNVLDKPYTYAEQVLGMVEDRRRAEIGYEFKYQQAKEKCIFEGISNNDAKIYVSSNWKIENLIGKTLTENKSKELGL